MDHRRKGDRGHRIRSRIAAEAARLMYHEGVEQYLHAKQIAARRILGREARAARFRPRDLPSNGEIRSALLQIVSMAEGQHRQRRLFAMRIVALRLMHVLQAWHPRLIGSVWSGHTRRGSDIDLHLFAEEAAQVEDDVQRRGWNVTAEDVLIRTGNTFRLFHHVHVHDQPFPVELSVYPLEERRKHTRSSVDGKTIDRVGPRRLADRIAADHPEEWRRWQHVGGLNADPEDLAPLEHPEDAEAPAPGAFDGLLAELAEDAG